MQNNPLNVSHVAVAHLGPSAPPGPLKPINNTSAGKRLQKKKNPLGLFLHCYLLYLCVFIARNCAKMTSAEKN